MKKRVALFLFATLVFFCALGVPRALASIEDLARGHSHNDYEQKHPLYDALDQGLYSVEADIWLRHGKILVSHSGFFFKGSLKNLYLDPLQRIVDRQGSIYGDGRELILWLDIKDGRAALRAALHELLERYPMLTVFNGPRTVRGPVTVVLTGDEHSKARYVAEPRVRNATRDSNELRESDPLADEGWSWYALRWSDLLHWSGDRPITPRERDHLQATIALAHAKGRKVRLWAIPGNEVVWKAAFQVGADQISADDLPRLHRFLEAQAIGSKTAGLLGLGAGR